MLDFLFAPKYISTATMLFQSFIVLAIMGLLFWFIFFILSKLSFYKKSSLVADRILNLKTLWAFVLLMIIWNVYFFILIRVHGLSNFLWKKLNTYLALFPQLLIYILLIVFFIVLYKRYKKNYLRS
jgi:hypothetical protein